jgi:lipid-A-disaccharide synthase
VYPGVCLATHSAPANKVRNAAHWSSYTNPIAASSNPSIFLSAGEASGDHYGAQIIAEHRRRHPGATFTGLGGLELEAAGQTRIVRAEDVAHMGITEVLRHAPNIYRQYRRLVGSIRRDPPALGILIDFPDVNFRLAKHLRQMGVPVLWFVSPQLWAWKRRRLRWVQQRVDRMLVIFPFEASFYRARGVEARFVGHPLAAQLAPEVTRAEYGARHHLNPLNLWISLLPGSRISEIQNNLPAMLDGVTQLCNQQTGKQYDLIIPVASTISPGQLLTIRTSLKPLLNPTPNTSVHFVQDARAALFHSRAAVVASGTATVQALTIGNPFIVVYRVSPLTFTLAKRLVRYPSEIPAPPDAHGNLPIAMPNLIAGRRIVPELLNEHFTPQSVAAALGPLLDDTHAREQMILDLAEARTRLAPPSGSDPIQQICDTAEELLARPAGVYTATAFSNV